MGRKLNKAPAASEPATPASARRRKSPPAEGNQPMTAPLSETTVTDTAGISIVQKTGGAVEPFEIDAEFESLLPRLTAEQLDGLSAQIEKSGHIDDLVVLVIHDERFLGDGHNRRQIAKAKGIPFKTREIQMGSRAEAVDWIVANQLSKRNLTDEQRAYYIGKSYLNAKQKAGGDRKSQSFAQSEQMIGSTAEVIAKQHGVSSATVRRSGEFAEAVDDIGQSEGPAAKQKILSGESGQTQEEIRQKRKPKKGTKTRNTTGKGKEKPAKSALDDTVIQTFIDGLTDAFAARGKTVGTGTSFDRCMKAMKAVDAAFKQWQGEKK